jgi:hypothetical protein
MLRRSFCPLSARRPSRILQILTFSPESSRLGRRRRACSVEPVTNGLKREAGQMKPSYSCAMAVLCMALLVGTPTFGKGGGHGGGHGHGGGGSHSRAAHSGGGHSGGSHSGGHPHSSGKSTPHNATGHAAPNHPQPQMTHRSPTHTPPQSRPTHPTPTTPGAAPHQHFARQNTTSNHTFSHSGNSGNGGHHGHHHGWGFWSDGGVGWDYDPNWYGPPGVVVVPEETQVVEPEDVIVTRPAVVATNSSTVPSSTVPSRNADETDPAQPIQMP